MQVLNTLPNEAIRVELYEDWEKNPRMTGAERWRVLKVGLSDHAAHAHGRGN